MFIKIIIVVNRIDFLGENLKSLIKINMMMGINK